MTPATDKPSRQLDRPTPATLPHFPQVYRDLAIYAARGGLQALSSPAELLTDAALCDWIEGAQAGESIQYHQGFLLLDRSSITSTLPVPERERVDALARRAWLARELGLVHLFSRRVCDGIYRYLAIRSGSTLKHPDIQARLRQPEAAPSIPTTD